MISESKNCLTCAFCTRNKDTYLSNFFKPGLSRWRYVQESLNTLERNALKKGDDSFIGQEIKDAELWDKQLEQERKKRQKSNGAEYLWNLQRILPHDNNVNEEAVKYGMIPRPKASDKDFLCCFHQQWNENKDSEIQKERKKFLEDKKCSFYYPFRKMGRETLEACEKNRKNTQERSRFLVTTALIIVGIIATIVLGAWPILVSEKPVETQPISAASAKQR